MDEELTWGPPRPVAVVLLLVGLGAAALAVAEDPLGRLLLGALAVLLLLAGAWTAAGPALTADAREVRVRGVVRTHVRPWAEVQAVVVDGRRRSRAVELETDDGLLAVPALLLGGVSPRAVAQQLTALRETAPR